MHANIMFTSEGSAGSVLEVHGIAADDAATHIPAPASALFDQQSISVWRTYWQEPQLAICETLRKAFEVACVIGKGVAQLSKALHSFVPRSSMHAADPERLRLILGAIEVISKLSPCARRKVPEHAGKDALYTVTKDWSWASHAPELVDAFDDVIFETVANFINSKGRAISASGLLAQVGAVQHCIDAASVDTSEGAICGALHG